MSFPVDKDISSGSGRLIVFGRSHEARNSYWASEASPTLGCSIEISCDIYICRYVCRYVCLSYVKLIA